MRRRDGLIFPTAGIAFPVGLQPSTQIAPKYCLTQKEFLRDNEARLTPPFLRGCELCAEC